MSHKTRKGLFRIGTLIVAGTLLYLGLRGVDFSRLGSDLLGGKYVWALPLFAVTLTSHLLRAFRWRILVHALPERDRFAPSVPIQRAFSSIMIGYMVNYLAPRFGEVVRTSHFALREKLSFGSIFGTVVAERLLDVLTLGLCLLTIPIVLGSRTVDLISIIVRPLQDLLQGNTTELLIVFFLGIVGVAAGLYLLFRKFVSSQSHSRFRAILRAFREGFLTLGRSGHALAIFGSTVAIWLCYAAMAYIPLLIFDMTSQGNISFAGAWALMLIGSIGMTLPSPGGVGSYHFFTIQALVVVWGFSQESAASYAIFSHGGQMVLHILTGFAMILLEGASLTDLKSTSLQDAAAAGIIEGSD